MDFIVSNKHVYIYRDKLAYKLDIFLGTKWSEIIEYGHKV